MPKFTSEKFNCHVKIDIPIPHICNICGLHIKSKTGISTHVINKHDLNYKEYLVNFLNINVDELNLQWENKRGERKEKTLAGLRRHSQKIKGISIKDRMSKEQYNSFRNNMKGVFSKDWYIKKYGEIEGELKHKERSLQLSKTTYWNSYNKQNKQNWSKISQELFWEIYKRISTFYSKIYFGELNHEVSCGIQNNNFDFVIEDIKKVIEFNGDKFHANPKLFAPNDIPLKFINLTSKEIWEKENIKLEKLKNKKYNVKIVWESDYRKNKDKTILSCIDFILNNDKNESKIS